MSARSTVENADTVGLVLEQRRPAGSIDRMRWHCQNCKQIVHEAAFHCTDLGTQIKAAVEAFKSSEENRTCRNCGELADFSKTGIDRGSKPRLELEGLYMRS